MDPITMLAVGSAVAKGAGGIMGAIGGHNNKVAEARARNQAMMDQYKQQLRIRDYNYKAGQAVYAEKLSQYHLGMDAADRAAATAYGAEQLKSSERIKKAAFTQLQLDRALAKSSGKGVASGKSGRSVRASDLDVEKAFVGNQNKLLASLLASENATDYRNMQIQNQHQSQRNQLFGQVAIAPKKPLKPRAPRQLSGPSTAGRNLAILNAGLGMAQGIGGAFAPAVGDMGGGGTGMNIPSPTTNMTGLYNDMSSYVANSPFG